MTADTGELAVTVNRFEPEPPSVNWLVALSSCNCPVICTGTGSPPNMTAVSLAWISGVCPQLVPLFKIAKPVPVTVVDGHVPDVPGIPFVPLVPGVPFTPFVPFVPGVPGIPSAPRLQVKAIRTIQLYLVGHVSHSRVSGTIVQLYFPKAQGANRMNLWPGLCPCQSPKAKETETVACFVPTRLHSYVEVVSCIGKSRQKMLP